MENIVPFLIFFVGIILQRIIELLIAASNEKWMKEFGAVEFGQKHYRYMVLMHMLFFAFYLGEKLWMNRGLSPHWPWLLICFLLTQLLRIWALLSLGRYWNTKIIVIPHDKVVKKGPYCFIKHPNYLVVSIEMIVIPVMFQAFFTAILFTVLNVLLLMIRIHEEEKVLKQFTEYEEVFRNCNRFLPTFVK